VGSVFTNLLTGSILVQYDPLVLAPAALLRAMQECGFRPPLNAAVQTPVGEFFARMAVRTLFELFVERLVVSLIAAVI
jgi:hypothetical protein